jgi:hypothetical protein
MKRLLAETRGGSSRIMTKLLFLTRPDSYSDIHDIERQAHFTSSMGLWRSLARVTLRKPSCVEKATGQRDAVKVFTKHPGVDERSKTEGLQQGIAVLMGVCELAWEELKTLLCSAPTLAFPDFDRDFILYTDGSKERGYGVALHQLDSEGVERPILFLSKALNAAEQNYWPIELETGALVWHCRNFHSSATVVTSQ